MCFNFYSYCTTSQLCHSLFHLPNHFSLKKILNIFFHSNVVLIFIQFVSFKFQRFLVFKLFRDDSRKNDSSGTVKTILIKKLISHGLTRKLRSEGQRRVLIVFYHLSASQVQTARLKEICKSVNFVGMQLIINSVASVSISFFM